MLVPFSPVIMVDSINFVLHDLGRLRKYFHATAATLDSTEINVNSTDLTGENIISF